MLGTRDLARLADHVRHAGGAIRLVGDPDQHGSVDVGGMFRRLCAERADGLVRLVDNNRQQDHAERLAIAEYRDGHVADALGRYDEAGKVVRSPHSRGVLRRDRRGLVRGPSARTRRPDDRGPELDPPRAQRPRPRAAQSERRALRRTARDRGPGVHGR